MGKPMTLEELRAWIAGSPDFGGVHERAEACVSAAIREMDRLRAALSREEEAHDETRSCAQHDYEQEEAARAKAQAELAAIKSATCAWTHDLDEDTWDSACGERWMFDDGGPRENNVRFCHGCGKRVRRVKADD